MPLMYNVYGFIGRMLKSTGGERTKFRYGCRLGLSLGVVEQMMSRFWENWAPFSIEEGKLKRLNPS